MFATRAKMISSNSSGGAEFYVGSFANPNATGTQAITGVGFTPKALLLFTSGSSSASGTWASRIHAQTIGFTSGATESYCVVGASEDNSGTSATYRRIADKAYSNINPNDGTVYGEADLTSFDADGFTLNWTDAGLFGEIICFLAIGGDGVSAKVVNWTSPTSTGNKAVTGVGFTPDVVLHAGSIMSAVPTSGGNAYVGFGAMDSAGGQWTNAVASLDGQATSDTARYQRTNKAIAVVNVSAVNEEAEFVSMDAGGFTLNFTTASTSAWNYISLCLSGVSAKAGSFTKVSSTSAVSQAVTGVGFEPGVVALTSAQQVAGTSVSPFGVWGMGAGDGTAQRAVAQGDWDNVATTNADGVWYSNRVFIYNGANVVVTDDAAALGSLDVDGFTLNWDAGTSNMPQILYLALRSGSPSQRAVAFGYTGAEQTWVVPAGVTSIDIECWGGRGGNWTDNGTTLGGLGGYSKGTLAVTPGETLRIYSGGAGSDTGTTAGWNGGGSGNAHAYTIGRGGGGATDVRQGGAALANRVIVAGGGGGCGAGSNANGYQGCGGGGGGGLYGGAGGESGANGYSGKGGNGGTQSAGGTTGGSTGSPQAGSLGQGGYGGVLGTSVGAAYAQPQPGGAGGAATGAAGGTGAVNAAGSGGGGSNYVGGLSNTTSTQGIHSGTGQVKITYAV